MSATEPCRILAIHHAPALAGGPLRLLNRVLQALAEAGRRSEQTGALWRAVLFLDESAARLRDRALLLLNAAGDPVTLRGPENGVLDENARARLQAAVLDTLAPTADADIVLERLLPAAGEAPAAAAIRLWSGLLGSAGLEVRAGSALETDAPPAAAIAPHPWPQAETLPARLVTWFGPRHLALLARLGLAPADVLAGEAALRAVLVRDRASAILDEARRMRVQLDEGLAALEMLVTEEDPRMLGSWLRFRRESRRTIGDFARRVERSSRNRQGIRGARLHQLCQGLRPQDAPQEDGLGMLAAAVLFELDLDRLAEHLPAFRAAARTGELLLPTVPGTGLLGEQPRERASE